MGNTFLKRVASDVHSKLGDRLSGCVFIFPNKRPGAYFLDALAQVIDKPLTAPLTLSIEEFIGAHSSLKIADPLQLLFQLYRVYTGFQPQEEFEKFYNWGNLMLKDYDEIDRYLLKTDALFKNLSAIKELEQDDMPDPMQAEFWNTIQEEAPHLLQQRFVQLWDVYSQTYYAFRKQLLEQQLAYPGMCYREVAELCQAGQLELPHVQYVFIGFNALSKSEEVIMASLIEQGKGMVYWDTDEWYLDQPREEAGYFIRKAMQHLPPQHNLPPENRLSTEEKSIHIIGVPLQVGQAKALGVELQDFLKNTPEGSTAVILPDENLLLPVLHALPKETREINITAGYPLQHTALFTLFENIIALQENFLPEAQSFYYKDVIAILSHPYLRCRNLSQLEGLVKDIEEQSLIYIHVSQFDKVENCPVIRIIFRPMRQAKQLLSYFGEILQDVKTNTSINPRDEAPLYESFETILSYLNTVVFSQEVELSRATWLRLFREAVHQARIPITGEKADAIQLMGMLETRCLNFDNIFILSVNEGTLPATKKGHSYIPFDLRKAFGMPTFDEQDSLYAYYFYRLLQGAKNIFLVYNSETGSRGEEKSRYIRQIEYYLAKANPNLKLQHRFFALPLRNREPETISIEKDDTYFKALEDKSLDRGLSPSLISAYFVCSLQFLLQHIIQLKPLEELSEDWEASDFGTLFHALMEEVYKEYIGATITPELIESRKIILEALLSKVLEKALKGQKEHIVRRNSLMAETIKVLAEKALDADMEYAPFQLIATEKKITHTIDMPNGRFPKVSLQGTIDRVDEKEGVYRIVDYKTGYVKRFHFNFRDAEEHLTKDNKEAFQTLFYSYLYHSQHIGAPLKPTLLPLREIARGYRQVNEADGMLKDEDYLAFEAKLKEIIGIILDKNIPVQQVDDLTICSVCNYTHFCLR